jgi:Ca2+-binding RTX toxin-like protein
MTVKCFAPHDRNHDRMVLAVLLLICSVLGMVVALGTRATPAANAAPVGQGFTITPSDLRFILKQIKIAEAHATREGTLGEPVPGQPLFGTGANQISSPLLPFGLRTVDGTYNNGVPGQSHFGAAHLPMPRHAPASFRDAEDSMIPGLGPVGPPGQTKYSQKKGNVVDSHPRVVSNLIVDQTATNPAAVEAALTPHRAFNDEPTAVPCESPGVPAECTPAGETLFIPNVTTDVGLSPPYNSLFTIFGQFFDHGLDSTAKSGGQVFVPLKADDPLIAGDDGILVDDPSTPENEAADNLPPHMRFMVITRAKNQPGPDGVVGDDPSTPEDESTDDVQDATNTDTPWVDQQQTYSSHSSHQVFLRAYKNNSAGRPVATGKLIEGDTGGQATWKDVKDQAASLLGIQLVDKDVFNIPLLATDEYGRYLRGPDRGLPQFVTNSGLVEGDTAAPVAAPADVRRINVAFLDDIAHNAVPSGNRTPDAGGGITPANGSQPANTYDNEMLNAHFMAGDGRVNENIALTAIHQVFHSEHNRLIGQIKDVLEGDTSDTGVDALAEWKLATGADGWNGERLFQAARFVTEMEYQHLVFEEFARKVQPGINPFNVFTQSDTGINPAIRAEFAHAVYRFGHSMLTDTVARTNGDGSKNDMPLIDAFLNPPAYYEAGGGASYTPEQAAGAIAMGMADQIGNELDEFVAEALRNNLLGLPLDLPTINMTRARETGVPSLNNFRKEIHRATNDSSLQPYSSWVDFGLSLKHQTSVVNFMAAYGKHPTIVNATTVAGKRAAAQAIYDQGPGSPSDSADFANSAGTWANGDGGVSKSGVDEVDLWVGGLAESQNLFGGLLGSTFNYVFERQMTDLQDGDRLYYLSRTSGMNLRTSLEGNSFGELVQRNTTAESLKADPFATADCEFDLRHPEFVGTGNLITDDPLTECDESKVLIRMADGTIRYRQTNSVDPPGINAQNTFMGTQSGDKIWGGVDTDTFWGNDGNDRIEGSDGDDVALGGEGRDIITDSAGADILKGGPGNDAIDSGPGIDVVMSGDGHDFMNGGLNDNATFAGEGDDYVIAGDGPDTVFGGGGNDWQEGGNANDLLQGDNGAPFFDDINDPGSDVLIGGSGEDDYDAEGGDDIMVAGPGIERNHGARGYDWATHARSNQVGDSDLTIHINAAPGQLADRFLMTEALSGWDNDDILRGDDWVSVEQDVELHAPWGSNALTNQGIERIAGLNAILAGNTECKTDPQVPGDEGEGGPPASGPPITICGYLKGNILLGGGGSDLIEGRGADDVIDGDAWLNHRLSVRTDPSDPTTETRTANAMAELQPDVFAGTLDPGKIVIVREIKHSGPNGIDTAVYSGPRADYDIDNTGTKLTVTHARNIPACCADQTGLLKGNGTDTLTNIERLSFADGVVEVSTIATNTPPSGTVTISDTTPAEDQALTATQAFTDLDGINAGTIAYTWQSEQAPGSWTPLGTGATFTPRDSAVGFRLRVVATYTDGDGVLESVTSAPTAAVSNVNDAPTGAAVLGDPTPQETVPYTVTTSSIADADGLPATFNYQWQQSGLNGTGAYANIAGATGATITPAQAQVNRRLRVVVSYTDNHGTAQSLTSAGSGSVVGDHFVGTGAVDTFNGTAGDDVALGRGGADTLNGNAGDDVLAGDAGDDTINGGVGNDLVQFTGTGEGFDAVTGAAGTDRIQALADGTVVGLESIGTVETVAGNPFANVRIEGSGAANTLNFAAVALPGIVTIDGGAGADTITGSTAADVILGGGGVDNLNGDAGNDTISGQNGDDTINGNTGDDVIRFGLNDGFDDVSGGNNADRVEPTVNGAVIGLRALTTVEQLSDAGHTGITVVGSGGSDNLNMSVTTLIGITTVDGAGGADNIQGVNGVDNILGSGGADVLNGRTGNDVLTGGAGDDEITGGTGDDRSVFGASFGADTLPGFDSNPTAGQDTLDLRPLGITAATFGANVTITGPAAGPTTVTVAGGGTITLPGVQPATVTQADFTL